MEQRRYVKAEVPKYDIDTQWEEHNNTVCSLKGINTVEEFREEGGMRLCSKGQR